MSRAVVLAIVALCGAAPLHAQATPVSKSASAPAAPGTIAAARPAGWAARFDEKDADPAAAVFTTMGKGLHFTTGPAATWYRAGEPVDGLYSVEATFVQTKAPAHPESYGLMIFGRQMETPTQNYVYFMVRGDGKWALKHRANDTDVHTIVDWTENAAVVKQDANGKARNALKIDVAADSVRFLVNGQALKAMSRTYLTDVSGVPGIRMNHELDVHVDGFAVTKK